MKEVASHDRPREKLERLGPGALGDNELLALVLGSGTRNRGALDVANRVLTRAGGLHGLTKMSPEELRQVSGVGRARAAQVVAAVEVGRRTFIRRTADRPRLGDPKEVAAFLLPQFGAAMVEQFGIAMLDSKNRLIRLKLVSTGSVDMAIVHPREVFREASAAAAATIVLFHNHPSGDPTPSAEDLALTTRLVNAGAVMGIEVVDHVILADQKYFSLLESGGMPQARMIGG